ncbi:MAG: ImmA/IrrE family metallo-endopeptidase [Bacteroidota bacterium]
MGKKLLELEIENKAADFRRKNGFSNTEPIRLKSLLLKLEVLTLFKPLSDSFSGMALKVDENRFMMVNSQHALGKQHFTIGHELYHLYIQENFRSKTCKTGLFDVKDPEEYRADLFSASLLLPQEGIREFISQSEANSITLQTILKIENYFSVSRRALLYRLKSLGYINSTAYEFFTQAVKKGAVQNGYTTTLYEPGNVGEVIGEYGILANKLYQTDKISESHYMELMSAIGINPLEEDLDSNGKW